MTMPFSAVAETARVPGMSVSLSTHVLDTAAGRPAAGVRVELFHDGALIASGTTDADGRIADLATRLESGRYTLVFHQRRRFSRGWHWMSS